MNQPDEIVGIIDHFIFQSLDTGFCVFVLQHKNQNTVVRGYTPNISAGQQVTLRGAWVMHPKFGKQFEAKACTASVPTSILGLKKYLGSGLIKGIGPTYAEKLVNRFGLDVLEVIDKRPHLLKQVDGIGPKRAETITTAWQDQKEIATIMVFLQEKGISTSHATKIYKKYGNESLAILKDNPYRLAEEIWGIGFKTADQIAQKLGFDAHSVNRVRAGILFAITNAVGSEGHLYIELEDLRKKTIELLELESELAAPLIKQALHELYQAEKIALVSPESGENHYVTLRQYYGAEKGLSTKLRTLMEYPNLREFDINGIYEHLRVPAPQEITLNEDQQRGIMACLQNKVTVITGGPGTGKTTLIKKLLSILEKEHVRYNLAAPTGRATQRITEGTGRLAMTLHRLLGFDANTFSFVHNEKNALSLDYLIVDEASMIDVFLAHAVVKALPLPAHLVLIGDVDQLPSVGAGAVLNDLIASGKIASVRLTEIFRQAQDSLIIVNAHRVNRGEFPTMSIPNSKKDFIYIKELEPEKVPDHLKSIFTNTLPRAHIPWHDAIVLVPMNRGSVGTQKINYDLQQLLNPDTTEKQIAQAGSVFKIKDRVMQLRNNYDKQVFNGDIGTIDDINLVDRALQVRFGDRIVAYDFSDLDELVLSYAITIHKSQGSEYGAVVIPLFTQHFTLLQRNLIYTAITRAKKLCILLGQPKAIAIAVKNNKGIQRKTFLKEFLTTDLQCR
jgi:exodeoxyribonuclease V alpha subunit